MLEKFVNIKNIGCFRHCNPKGDVSFRKLNLIFAENGRGKTTLCAVLRSLQTGQHEYISERETFGANEAASVQILLGGKIISFSNRAWSANNPEIDIFDSVFVHNSVYAGDYVDHGHKKNLYRVIIGTQGVQLSQRVDSLNEQIHNANTNLNAKRDALLRFVPQGITLEAYLSWQAIANIDAKIKAKSDEIDNQQRALSKADEIQGRGLFSKIQLPLFPSDFTAILSKQITDIIVDAEASVRQQIAQHRMGAQGETWLSQGLGYIANEQCPFCGQGIKDNDLIEAYRSHFNAVYKALKQEVAQLSRRVVDAIGDNSLNTTQQTLSGNLILAEFWRQFVEISIPDFPFDGIQKKYTTLRGLSSALAQQKQQSPTEAVSPNDDFYSALKAVVALQESVEKYNTAVDSCNARINEQKKAVQSAGNINTLQSELANLEARKRRFEANVVQASQQYQSAVQMKTQLEEQKRSVKEQLDQYCEGIIRIYESSINDYLDQFNTGFRIVNTQHNYRGGSPSSQFQIRIGETAVNLGDSRTPSGTPCFKTTLSSGDRSALSLAFFLASLKQDPDIAHKIVVLDDPFTSLDRFRRTCTQQMVRQLKDTAKQVIVLSHDPYFLKLLYDECPVAEVKVLQMSKIGNSTIIGEWDIVSETQSGYLKDHSVLLDFYRDRRGDPRTVVRAIRPFIEGLLRNHFPGHFQPDEWLGNFIDKIRSANPNSGLNHAQADLIEIEAINNYSKKFHHNQNPGADAEPIDSDELHGYVKRTLRLAGGE